jgi:hypothetical protein
MAASECLNLTKRTFDDESFEDDKIKESSTVGELLSRPHQTKRSSFLLKNNTATGVSVETNEDTK